MNHYNSELAAKANALLTLNRQIAGIKFAYTFEEFGETPVRVIRAVIAYCVAVKAAMFCKCVKLSGEFCGCDGGSSALGFEPLPEDFANGKRFQRLGLYKDPSTINTGGKWYDCMPKIIPWDHGSTPSKYRKS